MTIVDSPSTIESPWTVAIFAQRIKGYVDRLGTTWVEGEITQWSDRGSTIYGKIKDLDSEVTMSFTVWASVKNRMTARFAAGDRVLVHSKLDFWAKGGTLSMIVQDMRHVGIGEMLERLERLRMTLRTEGLFDLDRKRALPFLPNCIGLITGKDSDAEKDVLRNAQLRWPSVTFRVRHTTVQGDRAAGEVTAALIALDRDPEVDVIIVARGGGDFQNLLTFSDETLVRTAAACTTPIVSAIGHEADRPLLDDVADLRASTPTDAAKRVVPDVAEEFNKVQQVRSRLRLRMTNAVSREIDRVEQIRSRPVLYQSSWITDSRADELARLIHRSTELLSRRLVRAGEQVGELRGQLRALSPQRTLDRGYAIAHREDGAIVRTSADVAAGAVLLLTLADGKLSTTVNPRPITDTASVDSDRG
ncbi:MAG: exodeoxyribonuclease VII large subunit [Microbacteriaceae bacterium]|nr:exodeoxyribonuclease VII large subunit [Microbacteriaceae bacterium]